MYTRRREATSNTCIFCSALVVLGETVPTRVLRLYPYPPFRVFCGNSSCDEVVLEFEAYRDEDEDELLVQVVVDEDILGELKAALSKQC